ncbi:hypothetical protein SH2C18_29330 [Clostridium sediminicola]|uniref:hypothetical protein n=1 Tax=Clostridium sediminicola TaxID=3114879 RepID=UPI0031F2217F
MFLFDKGYLKSNGIGRGTKYYLTSLFESSWNSNNNEDVDLNNLIKENCNSDIFEGLNNDEIRIVQYIIDNGFITNKISREKLGFKKHKSTDLLSYEKVRTCLCIIHTL